MTAKELFQRVRDVWKKITDFLSTKEFIFYFPLAVFTVASFVLRSFTLVVVVAIWLITIFYGSKKSWDE